MPGVDLDTTNRAIVADGERPGVQEVAVSRSIDVPRRTVESVLSPERIVEFAGTYEVRAVEASGDAVVVNAGAADVEIVLEFTQTEPPYVYRQSGDRGPFDEMYTSLSLAGDAPVEVRVRTCFTFGLPPTRLTDWFAAGERRTELRRLVAGIEAAAREA